MVLYSEILLGAMLALHNDTVGDNVPSLRRLSASSWWRYSIWLFNRLPLLALGVFVLLHNRGPLIFALA